MKSLYHIYTTKGFKTYYAYNFIRHNDKGPAYIAYNPDTGNIIELKWYSNDKYHREDKPAVVKFYKGNIEYKYHYYNDMCHNENGPAYTEYNCRSNITQEKWYIHNKEFFTKSKWYEYYKTTPEYQVRLKKESVNIFD